MPLDNEDVTMVRVPDEVVVLPGPTVRGRLMMPPAWKLTDWPACVPLTRKVIWLPVDPFTMKAALYPYLPEESVVVVAPLTPFTTAVIVTPEPAVDPLMVTVP